jgi:hypothetical protein
VWVQVHVAVDDQQVQVAGVGEHGAQRRQFAGEECAGAVRADLDQSGGALYNHGGEPGLGGDH